ncbi:eukaryotic translation initiation factor 5-like [Papaver somniferum]|uniref:eukaryotic translation initiation factor 5-like n=1 Tax=Papaver somniferum TaxID=3469 RepID=UPI000E7029CB|nr:eukaryotic translation initiation factor 5-like [Papaver somniferum]
MALQNIGAVPSLVTKIEDCGNGTCKTKTNVVNMVDIAKSLSRPASYITTYFGYELRALSKFDKETGVTLVHGSHDVAKLTGLLEQFIQKFVRCHGCRNLETEVIIHATIQLKCAACGCVSDVDMRDKLSTLILEDRLCRRRESTRPSFFFR